MVMAKNAEVAEEAVDIVVDEVKPGLIKSMLRRRITSLERT